MASSTLPAAKAPTPLSSAAEAALARKEWIAAQDTTTGRAYYYNPATRRTVWNLDKELAAQQGPPPAVADADALGRPQTVEEALRSGEWVVVEPAPSPPTVAPSAAASPPTSPLSLRGKKAPPKPSGGLMRAPSNLTTATLVASKQPAEPVYRNVKTGAVTRNLAQWLDIDHALRMSTDAATSAPTADTPSSSADFVDVFLYGAGSQQGRPAADRILKGRELAEHAALRDELSRVRTERDEAVAAVRRLEATVQDLSAQLDRESTKTADLAYQLYYGAPPRTADGAAAVAAVGWGERVGRPAPTPTQREETLLRTVAALREHNAALMAEMEQAQQCRRHGAEHPPRDRGDVEGCDRCRGEDPWQRLIHNVAPTSPFTPLPNAITASQLKRLAH